ncbi:G-patch-domain-containing protein, partial [Neoconidiobolus thromboides FSU 785]
MGLSEPRKKQRIGEDPQNTTWSQNTSRFGFKMLEKMGWTPGNGLGLNEDGSKVHIKTSVKIDQRGLGADAKTEDNWIENTSGFSQLLAKLNAGQT